MSGKVLSKSGENITMITFEHEEEIFNAQGPTLTSIIGTFATTSMERYKNKVVMGTENFSVCCNFDVKAKRQAIVSNSGLTSTRVQQPQQTKTITRIARCTRTS
ncbi:hypothetical protein CHS0354_010780 [Potamilus streckersoni]|uniref:Uncharacterized protein n=1 Tax=Potamilus streckersoni TaxID=2493646 RepID=A0AAE0W9L2_9BIVA|nr:hypothetical protein CHS0354_010780 [Potamilus streckersoni]